MAIWGSQAIHFVWFLAGSNDVKTDQIFQLLTGEEPDNIQRNKTPNPVNPFLSSASGHVPGIVLTVQLQPGRLDAIFTAPEDDIGDEDGVPLLDTEAVFDLFVGKAEAISTSLGGSLRLAVVANLVKPSVDESAACASFLEAIGYDLGVSDARDLLFQVNRRKALEATNVEMNRIMRFGVSAFQKFVFQLELQTPGTGTSLPISKQNFGMVLTLDFNTVPTGQVIESERCAPIFKEILEELKRVALNGSPRALAG
jgi:hypothetical protein